MRSTLLLALVLASGCSERETPPPRAVPIDAAAVREVAPVIDADALEPEAEIDLDGGGAQERVATHDRRILHIMLTSTPSGAIAAVDCQPIGPTPTYWEGPFTGGRRKFTFVRRGHASAVYSFVPVSDGFVHGRLHKLTEDGDAGVPAIAECPRESPPPRRVSPAPRERRATPRPAVPIDAGPAPIDAAPAPAQVTDAGA